MRKIACLTLIMLLGWQVSWAQELLVKGVVISAEDGFSIPGVSVFEKGTTNGATTDFDGNYELKVKSTSVLVFSFVGMKTIEIVVGTQKQIDVRMETENVAMDEVIVVGYGVQKKSDVTGSVSSIRTEDIEDQPVGNAAALLQGRAAGVMITQASGAPGAGLSVRVRGTGTVNNSSPLYVVDGIFLDGISHLNPSDIENMEVLKDASATAIYGSRGANGVILITTKTGKTEKTQVQIELMSGIQKVWNTPDLMNSKDWLATYNASQANAAKFTNSTSYKPLALRSPSDDVNHTTDWFDEITRIGEMHKANITLSKGNQSGNSLFSAGYYQNKGVVENSKYERINLRLNNNYVISSKIKAGINVSLSHVNKDDVAGGSRTGVLTQALRVDPITPVYQSSGEFASTPYSDLGNPVAQLDRDVREYSSLLLLANSYLEYKPVKNLIVKSSLSLNLSRSKTKTFLPAYNYGNEKRPVNNLTKKMNDFDSYLSENTINYTLDSNNHNLSLLVGFTAEQNKSEYIQGSINNIPNNDEELQYLSASPDIESASIWNSGEDTRMYSYLGRINYNYNDTYLFTASFRRDGSSVFGPDKRFGNFPSTSVGWKIRNEEFMSFIPEDLMNRIKLRAGWGRVGNANIDPYTFASTVQRKDSKLEYSYVFGGNEYPGAAPVKMENSKIQWETVESTNFGLDLAFLNDKITFSGDYFVKKTKDMLVQVPISYYSGYDGSPYVNAGSVENKGFELNLGYRGQIGSDLKFSVNVNASHIENEVTSLGGGTPIIDGNVTLVGSVTRTMEGLPIGSFYGYEVDGVFQTNAEVAASAQKNDGVGAGDFRFKDQWTDKNKDGVMEAPDGVLNADDRVMIGDPNPDLFYGINIDLNYKNFDVSMFFQGVYGNELFNAFKFYNYADNKKYALANDYKNHWTPENGSNSLFGLNAATVEKKNLRASDFYIEDGSYFRLKNLQVGYTFRNLTGWMSNVRVYFSGQNLFTITDYSGLDPEIGASNSSKASLTQGIDFGSYPQARIFSIGANLTF